MEQDPSYKQLIPYVIFQHVSSSGQPTVFQYRRGTGQGEKRLHSKRSVGVGGHISSDDLSSARDLHPYEEGMLRELAEEVQINSPYTERLVGLINDDATDVGRVHLGVVHVFDVEAPDVSPREADIVDTGFTAVQELLADLDGFESWSRICLEAIFGRN
jgi:predicted NUDIX family phosphoesterase